MFHVTCVCSYKFPSSPFSSAAEPLVYLLDSYLPHIEPSFLTNTQDGFPSIKAKKLVEIELQNWETMQPENCLRHYTMIKELDYRVEVSTVKKKFLGHSSEVYTASYLSNKLLTVC